MSLSVIDPIDPAIKRTKLVLFDPFDFGKWLRLGFCAFLANLMSGGGSGGGGGGPGGGSGGGPGGGAPVPAMEPAVDWFQENFALIMIIVAAVIVFMVILGLVLTWLSSRGQFMLIDGVVRNRGAVVEPWHEYRAEGNSLFWFRVILGLLFFLVIVVIGGLALLIGLPNIRHGEFGVPAAMAIAFGVLSMVILGITYGVIGLFLRDFVVPVMYLRRIPVMAAWSEFRQSLLAGHAGLFILYILMKIVISMVTGFIALFAVCCTCCVAAIPYVGAVILLPISVFLQCYSLYFIEQFGPKWQFFPATEAPLVPPIDPSAGFGNLPTDQDLR